MHSPVPLTLSGNPFLAEGGIKEECGLQSRTAEFKSRIPACSPAHQCTKPLSTSFLMASIKPVEIIIISSGKSRNNINPSDGCPSNVPAKYQYSHEYKVAWV